MEIKEFKDLEELKDYIKIRAKNITKFKLRLAHHHNTDTSKETLNDLYKASLHEIKEEILEGYRNGTIIILNQSSDIKKKLI